MSRIQFTIIIIAVILIGLGGLGYFIYTKQQEAKDRGESITFRDFFPFGTSGSVEPTPNTNGDGTELVGPDGQPIDDTPLPVIRILSEAPVAGAKIFEREQIKEIPAEEIVPGAPVKPVAKPETELIPSVRFVDRATGHIYELPLGSRANARKLSNTTIPRIHEALFGPGAKTVLYRFLRNDNATIETYSAKLPEELLGGDMVESDISGLFLEKQMLDLSLSLDGSRIAYVSLFGTGSAVTVSQSDGTKKTLAYSSPLKEWLVSWSGGSVGLTTKPSGKVPGYFFNLDLQSKTLSKVLGGVNGLTALPNQDGSRILFGSGGDGTATLLSYDKKTGSTSQLGIDTIPEKCVWSDLVTLYCAVPREIPPGVYPDAWYQGTVMFEDSFWKIDTTTKTAVFLINPSDIIGREVDAIKLEARDGYLIFTDKNDLKLYSYTL